MNPQFYRLGECPIWLDREWAGGEEIGVKLDQNVVRSGMNNCQTMEVQAVSWELHTESDRDLNRLLWLGSLYWSFAMVAVAIGPLSMFAGSEADRRFPQDRGDIEKLAEVANQGPCEEVWRAFAQTLSVGQSLFFRGQQTYHRHCVALPANSEVKIQLRMSEPYTLEAPVRLRVVLHGILKSVVEIG